MVRYLYLFLLIFFFNNLAYSQYKYQPVLSGLSGQALLDKLVENYKPLTVLDYGTARDTLFFNVYRQNDSLACIYSDFKLPLPNGVDPTTFVYMNGSKDGINCEHAYPQSKGAVGGAKSDMNILYPAKASVNEVRGNLPYGDSPDNKTQIWYYKKAELSSIPTVNKDLYSELNASVFEPRESFKGNVARAVFYFFTMYHEEAITADPAFFNSQVNTLCQWHLQDPVDSLEWERAAIISKYQNGRKNPYVLDCTLPYRTFCPNYLPNCDTSLTASYELRPDQVKVYPNPTHDAISFCLADNLTNMSAISVFNLNGTLLINKNLNSTDNCVQLTPAEMNLLEKGMYIVKIAVNNNSNHAYYITKFIKL